MFQELPDDCLREILLFLSRREIVAQVATLSVHHRRMVLGNRRHCSHHDGNDGEQHAYAPSQSFLWEQLFLRDANSVACTLLFDVLRPKSPSECSPPLLPRHLRWLQGLIFSGGVASSTEERHADASKEHCSSPDASPEGASRQHALQRVQASRNLNNVNWFAAHLLVAQPARCVVTVALQSKSVRLDARTLSQGPMTLTVVDEISLRSACGAVAETHYFDAVLTPPARSEEDMMMFCSMFGMTPAEAAVTCTPRCPVVSDACELVVAKAARQLRDATILVASCGGGRSVADSSLDATSLAENIQMMATRIVQQIAHCSLDLEFYAHYHDRMRCLLTAAQREDVSVVANDDARGDSFHCRGGARMHFESTRELGFQLSESCGRLMRLAIGGPLSFVVATLHARKREQVAFRLKFVVLPSSPIDFSLPGVSKPAFTPARNAAADALKKCVDKVASSTQGLPKRCEPDDSQAELQSLRSDDFALSSPLTMLLLDELEGTRPLHVVCEVTNRADAAAIAEVIAFAQSFQCVVHRGAVACL